MWRLGLYCSCSGVWPRSPSVVRRATATCWNCRSRRRARAPRSARSPTRWSRCSVDTWLPGDWSVARTGRSTETPRTSWPASHDVWRYAHTHTHTHSVYGLSIKIHSLPDVATVAQTNVIPKKCYIVNSVLTTKQIPSSKLQGVICSLNESGIKPKKARIRWKFPTQVKQTYQSHWNLKTCLIHLKSTKCIAQSNSIITCCYNVVILLKIQT